MAPNGVQRGSLRRTLTTSPRAVVAVAGVLVSLVSWSDDLSATTAVAPELTVETIAGTWECIHPDAPSVLRIDIRKPAAGPSYVALASGDGAAAEAAVFRVSRLSVIGGNAEVAADDLTRNSPLSVILTGKGHAYSGRGRIDGSFIVQDRNDKRPGFARSVSCVKHTGGYIRTLLNLYNAAERQSRLAGAP